MRTFTCSCGNTLYFDNTQCLQCGKPLGFDPAQLQLLPLVQVGDRWQSDFDAGQQFRKCQNYEKKQVCNWLIPAKDDDLFCVACRLNSVIPDLSTEQNRERWFKLEKAKRRLIYTLKRLYLPIIGHKLDPDHGLAFRFMEDVKALNPFSEEIVTYQQIMTGHSTGTITINTIEADDSAREKIRENMNESYRTILGHFRHEIGHYYWDHLIARSDNLPEFRHLFGDERENYEDSLKHYYEHGPAMNWADSYISAYASAHPWEDWAESWAHYLHSVDILETASHHHVGVQGEEFIDREQDIHDWLKRHDFPTIVNQLAALVSTLNELNRSLGFPDPYPFEHSPNVVKKLSFIHRIVMDTSTV